MAPMALPLAIGVAFLLTAVATPVAGMLARRIGRIAHPRADRWHSRSIPLLGGIAIATGFLALVPAAIDSRSLTVVSVCAAGAFLLGLVDDVRGMSPATKIVGQVVVATLLFFGGIGVRIIDIPPVAYVLTVLWVVGVMNAINLLDNMDGVAAGVTVIAAGAMLVPTRGSDPDVAMVAGVTMAVAAGFLLHNFPPARIFMGDSGSQMLGLLLGTTALMDTVGSASGLSLALVGPLLILAVPIFDVALVATSRFLVGIPVHRGGRDHTSHRLSALGLSEKATVLTLYAITAALAGVGLLTATLSPLVLPVLIVTITALVLFGVALSSIAMHPSTKGERRTGVSKQLSSYTRFGLEILLDLVLLTTAYYTSYAIRFENNAYTDWSEPFVASLPIVVAIQMLAFVGTRMYKTLWRYLTLGDVLTVLRSTTLGTALAALVLVFVAPIQGASRAVLIIDWVLVTAMVLGARLFLVWLFGWIESSRTSSDELRALVVGAAERGYLASRLLLQASPVRYRTLGFIDNDVGKRYRRLAGLPILGGIADLEAIIERDGVDAVVIAAATPADAERVQEICRRLDIECRQLGIA